MKRAIVYIIVTSYFIALIVILAHRKKVPTYQGLPASVWLSRVHIQQNSDALVALQKMGSGAIPTLRQGLASRDHGFRLKSVWVLGQIGQVARLADSELIRAIDVNDESIQVLAIQALMSNGNTSDLLGQKLLHIAQTNQTALGVVSANAIIQMEEQREASHLQPLTNEFECAIVLIKSAAPTVRLKGIQRLLSLSTKDAKFTNELEQLTKDDNVAIRGLAFKALHNTDRKKTENATTIPFVIPLKQTTNFL